MKSLVLVLIISISLFANELSSGAVKEVQQLIKSSGYKCDTIDNTPSFSSWDGSIKVICNNFKYVYEVKDIGGKWTVKVK